MNLKYLLLVITAALLFSCDLEQLPQDTTSKGPVFSAVVIAFA